MTALTQSTGKQWGNIQVSKLNCIIAWYVFFRQSMTTKNKRRDGGSRKCTLYRVSGAGEADSNGFRDKKYFPCWMLRAHYHL